MRQLTNLISLLLLSLLVAIGCQNEAEVKPGAPIVGAWRSQVQFESGPFASVKDLTFMYAIHDDKTLMESSNYDGAPPVPPAYGLWREIGERKFELRYEFFVTRLPDSADGLALGSAFLPAGRGVLTEVVSLAADGNAFESTIKLTLLDIQGQESNGGTAHSRGTRMRHP